MRTIILFSLIVIAVRYSLAQDCDDYLKVPTANYNDTTITVDSTVWLKSYRTLCVSFFEDLGLPPTKIRLKPILTMKYAYVDTVRQIWKIESVCTDAGKQLTVYYKTGLVLSKYSYHNISVESSVLNYGTQYVPFEYAGFNGKITYSQSLHSNLTFMVSDYMNAQNDVVYAPNTIDDCDAMVSRMWVIQSTLCRGSVDKLVSKQVPCGETMMITPDDYTPRTPAYGYRWVNDERATMLLYDAPIEVKISFTAGVSLATGMRDTCTPQVVLIGKASPGTDANSVMQLASLPGDYCTVYIAYVNAYVTFVCGARYGWNCVATIDKYVPDNRMACSRDGCAPIQNVGDTYNHTILYRPWLSPVYGVKPEDGPESPHTVAGATTSSSAPLTIATIVAIAVVVVLLLATVVICAYAKAVSKRNLWQLRRNSIEMQENPALPADQQP